MRQLIILAILLAFSQMSQGQETGFSIGIGGSYDKRINEYAENPYFGADHEFADIQEYSFGLQVNYQFKKRLGIRSGVSYARKGYKLTYAWIVPDGGNGTGHPLIPMETEFRLDYLDIPLGVYYAVVNTDRYHLSPSLGILNSFLIGETEVSEMGDGASKETEFNTFDTNPYLLGARLGLINDFVLSESIFISLEPYVMYNTTKLNDTDIVNSDFAFGGYLSVNYRFNE